MATTAHIGNLRKLLRFGRDQIGLVHKPESDARSSGTGHIVGLQIDGLACAQLNRRLSGHLPFGVHLVEQLLAIDENLEAVFA